MAPRGGIIALVIALNNVGVTYPTGQVTALKEVSFRLDAGEFAFLVGPTGAGKSTLLKLLYAEVRATQGSVQVAGRELTTLAAREIPALRRQMGIILQDYGLLPQRTVWENVRFACEVLGVRRREARQSIKERLEQVGMLHRCDAFPAQLSGGEQQRVAIARALVGKPALLIADEPTGNLDPETSAGIMDALLSVSAQGTTVLVATHDKNAVDRLRRRVLAIEKGALARDEAEGSYGYDQ
jgi:cell division transport system ATP-binding protein